MCLAFQPSDYFPVLSVVDAWDLQVLMLVVDDRDPLHHQDMTPLEEIERLRAELLGVVSHELRTLLAAIRGGEAGMASKPRAWAQAWKARHAEAYMGRVFSGIFGSREA